MNLNKLFAAQKELDAHIEREKELEGQDLLDKKILALQVELGELANEWRGFKFWSENQKPNTEEVCWNCEGEGGYMGYIEAPMIEHTLVGCEDCNETGVYKKPLLEEYADCLSFILSIGNDINIYKFEYVELIDLTNNITTQFNSVFQLIGNWKEEYLYMNKDNYSTVVNEFLCLGEMLGFTWEQVEQAYYEKNKINHERQANGY